MRKLGKTAEKILASMESRYRRYGATHAIGLGSEGGKINEGSREYEACHELVAKGYTLLDDKRNYIQYQRGYGIHCYEITIKLAIE